MSVISFASESLFFIHIALKIRFDLGWFPNQNFIMLCSPLPSLSILEFRVHQRQRKAVLVPLFRIPRRLRLSPPSTAHTGFYQREGKNQGGKWPSPILPALPDTAIQPDVNGFSSREEAAALLCFPLQTNWMVWIHDSLCFTWSSPQSPPMYSRTEFKTAH